MMWGLVDLNWFLSPRFEIWSSFSFLEGKFWLPSCFLTAVQWRLELLLDCLLILMVLFLFSIMLRAFQHDLFNYHLLWILFLVANSNSSNSCTPSVCQSLGRSVTHCEIIFIWGWTVQSPCSTSTVHHIVHCTVQLFIQSIVLFIVQLNVQIIVQFITIKKTRLFATRGFSTLFSNARPLSLLFLVYIFVISFRWMFLMKWKFLI